MKLIYANSCEADWERCNTAGERRMGSKEDTGGGMRKKEIFGKFMVSALAALCITTQTPAVYAAGGAGWRQDAGTWRYYNGMGKTDKGWIQTATGWYYLDPATGNMKTGWLFTGGRWYFLNPNAGGAMGKMMTGWQWIDGHCYYFEAAAGNTQGGMYAGERTPDGYLTDASGHWVSEDGSVQYVEGKGISTKGADAIQAKAGVTGVGTRKGSGASSSGGSGSGRRSGRRTGGGGKSGKTTEKTPEMKKKDRGAEAPENTPEKEKKGEGLKNGIENGGKTEMPKNNPESGEKSPEQKKPEKASGSDASPWQEEKQPEKATGSNAAPKNGQEKKPEAGKPKPPKAEEKDEDGKLPDGPVEPSDPGTGGMEKPQTGNEGRHDGKDQGGAETPGAGGESGEQEHKEPEKQKKRPEMEEPVFCEKNDKVPVDYYKVRFREATEEEIFAYLQTPDFSVSVNGVPVQGPEDFEKDTKKSFGFMDATLRLTADLFGGGTNKVR